jgi:hypothetical protein
LLEISSSKLKEIEKYNLEVQSLGDYKLVDEKTIEFYNQFGNNQ